MESNGNGVSLKKETTNFANGSQSPGVMENRLEALTVLCNSILREIEALKKTKNAMQPPKIDLAGEVAGFEKDLIRCALLRTGGRQRQAARLLHVKVTTLNAKIKRYGITPNGLYQESE
jgi:DNA-binding NtrC family response regulator